MFKQWRKALFRIFDQPMYQAAFSRYKPRSVRLGIDHLESRDAMAVFTVTTFADVMIPNDGVLSLREAISMANTTPAADTINLRAGVYQFAGKESMQITQPVTIQGASTGITMLDAMKRGQWFEIVANSPFSVTLSRMTFRNGFHKVGGAVFSAGANLVINSCQFINNFAAKGGAVFSNGGTVTINNSTFLRNRAIEYGGAIHMEIGQLTVNNSTLRLNTADFYGGAILADELIINNSQILQNVANTGGGGLSIGKLLMTNTRVVGNSGFYGGGISCANNSVLTNSSLSGNKAEFGGGIFGLDDTSFTMMGCTVDGNVAHNSGGGIYATTAIVNSSTLSNNEAKIGGGAMIIEATLVNSTISSNTASNGGGLYVYAGDILNCTFTENYAASGGGIFHQGNVPLLVRNTIIAQNLGPYRGNGVDVFGVFASLGHNLIGDRSGSTGFDVEGDQTGTKNDPLDALLAPLANNGGRTMTHALLRGSAAIDRGNSNAIPATDQRGQRRLKDGNGDRIARVDIGAFEL